jgi:hypothetical protein
MLDTCIIYLEDLKGTDYFGDLGLDGKIILIIIKRKKEIRLPTVFF